MTLQPFAATDVIAFLLLLIGLIFIVLRWRSGETGLGCIGAGLTALGVFYATNRLHMPVDRHLLATPWYFAAGVGLHCLALGLADYLNLTGRRRARALAAMQTPTLFLVVLCTLPFFGVQVPRVFANVLVAAAFAAMGVTMILAARREPGAGHGLVGAALLALPLVAAAMRLTGSADTLTVRYAAPLPVMAMAFVMLTTYLLRGRRELEAEIERRRAAEARLTALNESLEHTVAERTDDLQRLVEGLETFNRSVSHDLRGALGSIAHAARQAHDELKRGQEDFPRAVLPLIADQADHSQRQMDALLSLARATEGGLQRQSVDLGELVREVVEELRRGIVERQPVPRIEIEDALPTVPADLGLLRPVFVNLIGNAIKFTREAPAPLIQIGAREVDGEVEVFVKDNGPGFDAAAAERLFEPFVRLHGPRFEGHGVGLSIVRRAVERHGGRVWAESQDGRGAAFFFRLPLTVAAAVG